MTERVVKQASDVKLIVFACEAGMGSSLMGANQLKKMVKKAKLDVNVVHSPVTQLTEAADVVVTCAPEEGLVPWGDEDCDDTDPTIHPGAFDRCLARIDQD